jgi:hypothetical protein
MSGVRFLDGVHGEDTNGIDEVLVPGGALEGWHKI